MTIKLTTVEGWPGAKGHFYEVRNYVIVSSLISNNTIVNPHQSQPDIIDHTLIIISICLFGISDDPILITWWWADFMEP